MTPSRQAGHAVPGASDGALTGLRWWPFIFSRLPAPSCSWAARAILDASAGLTRVVSLAISAFMSLVVVPPGWLPGFGQGRALGLGTAILLGAIVWLV